MIYSKMFKIVSFKLCKAKLHQWSRKSFVTLYQYQLHPMPGCLTHKVYCGFADINIKILSQIKWLANWIVYLTNISDIFKSQYFNMFHLNAAKRIHESNTELKNQSSPLSQYKIPRNCIKMKLLFPKWVFPFSIVINLKNNRAQRCLFVVFYAWDGIILIKTTTFCSILWSCKI